MARAQSQGDVLSRIAVFRGVDARALAEIRALARKRTYRPQEVVVRQGDTGDGLFVIATGFLKVSVSGPTGSSTTLSIMGPHEMFGELSLLDGGPRSATVTAVTRADLLAIDRDPFLKLFKSRPSVAIALVELVARRLRRLSERSDDVSGLPVSSRLAKQLLQLGESHAFRVSPSRVRLAIRLSQRELGELIGTSRESVNKHLSRWKQRRIVDEENGFLVITDLERLRALAASSDPSGE
jgi:CRP/FNR family transcriptional regulator, cyclic AMP receptor protein